MIGCAASVGIMLMQWQLACAQDKAVEHIRRFARSCRHDARAERCEVVGQVGVDFHPRFATILCIDVSGARSEEHTSELQSLMRISYAVFCLKKKKTEAG